MSGGKWRQAKHVVVFGHWSLFLYMATKLLPELLMVHNEIFQGDVLLLSKPVLNLGFDSACADQLRAIWWVCSTF
jgi:hypothetical protein